MKKFIQNTFAFLASNGLACVLLILLMAVTFFGTIEQVDLGLYEAKHRYFESFFVVHRLFGVIPIPLPGVYLLTFLTAINLICGGIVRIRKGISQYGVIVAHAAVVLLLLGGWVKYEFGTEGYLTLHESEQSSEFELPLDWEIALWTPEDPTVTEYLIPQRKFSETLPNHPGRFHHAALPFSLEVEEYFPHCFPQPAGAQSTTGIVDGFLLQPAVEPRKENRIPGARVRIVPENADSPQEGLLWAGQRGPLTFLVEGKTWLIDLRRQRHALPFEVRLDKFVRELHPRTNLPRAFTSHVTRIDDGNEVGVAITMNEPLRYKGYTLYQASWGPQDARPDTPLYSVLAVSYDPAERLPLYSCIILTAGLAFHFGYMLVRRLRNLHEEAHA